MSQRILFVSGATGFLGSHVCRAALAAGWAVRALVRPGADRGLVADVAERIAWLEGTLDDLVDDPVLGDDWLYGTKAVVHAAAATSEHTSDWAVSRRLNVEATRLLAESALRAGPLGIYPRRFVFVSSQSAHPANSSPYGTTKLEAERALAATGAAFTVLRPGVIYGLERRGIFAKLEKTIQQLPLIPIIGQGEYLQYPVHADDVATAALAAIDASVAVGRTYELGGAAPIAFIDLVRLLMRLSERRKPLVRLPVPLCRLIATVGGAVMKEPPINHSNIEGLLTAPPLDIEPARRDLGYAPRGVEEGLAEVWRRRAEEAAR